MTRKCFSAALVAVLLAITVDASRGQIPENIESVLETKRSFNLAQFPIGFWNYVDLGDFPDRLTEAEVQEWADCGFTVPQGPEFNPGNPKQRERMLQILDWCKARNMRMIAVDPRNKVGSAALPEDYAAKVMLSGADFAQHPAVFGFRTADEPPGEILAAVADGVRLQRERFPQLHPLVNWWAFWPEWNMHPGFDSPNAMLADYVKKSKSTLLCFDNYTQMWPSPLGNHPKYGETGVDKYFLNLVEFRKASLQCGIPYWATLLSVGCMNHRVPSYDDLRWQFNSAICSGASGIQWFFYYLRYEHENYRMAPIDENWQRTETWYALQKIHQSFHKRYGNLFNTLASTSLEFVGQTFGGGDQFKPDDIVSKVEPNPDESDPKSNILVGRFVDKKGNRFVMIVNNSAFNSIAVDVTFPGQDVKLFSWKDGAMYEGLAYSAKLSTPVYSPDRSAAGVKATHFLAPGQEAFYRVQQSRTRTP